MALVDCPKCKKRISDKAKECQHCQLPLADMDTEQRANFSQIEKLKRAESLMNQSMIAMLLFCGGFGFMFWGDPAVGSWQHSGALGTTAIGFIWYVINRFRIILMKRK